MPFVGVPPSFLQFVQQLSRKFRESCDILERRGEKPAYIKNMQE